MKSRFEGDSEEEWPKENTPKRTEEDTTSAQPERREAWYQDASAQEREDSGLVLF